MFVCWQVHPKLVYEHGLFNIYIRKIMRKESGSNCNVGSCATASLDRTVEHKIHRLYV